MLSFKEVFHNNFHLLISVKENMFHFISIIDAGIQKKRHGSGMTTLIISSKRNEWYNEVFKTLKDSSILLKIITKTIEHETKEQKGKFLGIPLGTLDASLLGNMLGGKDIVSAGYGNKQGQGIVRASYCFKMDF